MNVEQEREDEGPQHVLAAGPVQAVALRSLMLTGLFLLALFHTLLVARDLFLRQVHLDARPAANILTRISPAMKPPTCAA